MSLLAAAFGLALFGGADKFAELRDLAPKDHAATCAPVPLDPTAPTRTRAGQLTFISACVLASPSIRVSGLSAIEYDRAANRLYALHDGGLWVLMTPLWSGDRLTGFTNVRSRPFHDIPITSDQKAVADSEGLALLPDRSALAVSFEDLQTIRFYSLPATDKDFPERIDRPLKLPPGMILLPPNGGVEALSPLKDGRLVAFAERPPGYEPLHPVWLIGETEAERLSWRPRDKFQPTGADLLENGDILLTTRRFSMLDGVAIRIERIRADALKPGAVLEGEILAELRPPTTVDNFEGLTVISETEKTARILIVSDDNQNILQRTIFMMFELAK